MPERTYSRLSRRRVTLDLRRATTTLWRPVGPAELELLRAAGWTRWPPRLPEQPIFYPVLKPDYAVRAASDWNVRADRAGHVTEFEVPRDYLHGFEVHQVCGATIQEYWTPPRSCRPSTTTSSV